MKCALYCRLSEEDRNKQFENDDSNSIINQKALLTEYALDKGWEIYDIYSDDDYTGSDRNRPEFKRLLDDAEHRRFNVVICKTQSRFTRELEIVEKYVHGLFPEWGIRFIGIVDNADTELKGNKKSRQINGLVNEWYLEDMSENIKSVLDNRRQNGYHIGSFALYGYQKDPNQKGHLIIDEEAANVVREVFTLFAKGNGKTAIAKLLNERGIPNPTEYKRLKGLRYSPPKSKQATLWKYYAISDMLSNEIYLGHMVQGKYGSISYKSKTNKPKPKEKWIKVENTHEAIIDIELWNQVQQLIKQKAKPFKNGNIGLFAKKVRCADCGYIMRSSKCHDKYYLQCTTRHVSIDACSGAFISVEKLEAIVLEELKKLCSEMLDLDEIERNATFNNNQESKIEELKLRIIEYEKLDIDCSNSIKNLYIDKTKGIINENDFIELSHMFHKDKEKYQTLIKEAKSKIVNLEERKKNIKNQKQLVEQYTQVDSLNREMVDLLIESIYVDKGESEVSFEIRWNF